MKIILRLLLAISLFTPFLTGCLGPKVLKERTEHIPATDPHVELRIKTNSPADVLVIYDDENPDTHKVTRRAFYLFANFENVTHGKRPWFVSPSRGKNLPFIPAIEIKGTNVPSDSHDLCALFSSPCEFKLISRDREIADFGLPKFGDWLTVKKLLLFPGAVAADATVIVPVVGAQAVAEHPDIALEAAKIAVQAVGNSKAAAH